MTKSERQAQIRLFRVGVMTALSIAIFAAVVVSIGSTQGAFSRKATYHTYFRNIGGLSESAPVKLSGVPIGSVADITFAEDIARPEIRIEFQVDRRKSSRIRGGTKASLKSLSLLSGEKYIELTPGNATSPPLDPGSVIPADEKGGDISEISGAATDVAAEVVKIADNLNRVLVSINEGKGLLGRAVADPDFGKPTLDALQGSLEEIQDILVTLRSGKSAAGRLLSDQQYGERVTKDLEAAVTSLRSILDKVDRGDGVAAAILNEPESGKAILNNLVESTETLKTILADVREGKGLAGKLLFDKAYGERVTGDLEETLANLKSISAKIDRGDGTIAKVVNDPGLYASLHDIVGGIEKSKIVGAILRHYQKKGLQNRTQEKGEVLGPEGALRELEEIYGEELGAGAPGGGGGTPGSPE